MKYQLNPLLEGNGVLSTAKNVANQTMKYKGIPQMANVAADKSLPFFTRAKGWLGSKFGKISTSKLGHKLDRNLDASKLRSVRRKEGSEAGRAFRDYLVKRERI